MLPLAIEDLVPRPPDRLIVVNTCLGNDKSGRGIPDWNGMNAPFLNDFDAVGFDPDAVDTGFCTRMHSDHVRWNTMKAESSAPLLLIAGQGVFGMWAELQTRTSARNIRNPAGPPSIRPPIVSS